jgi:TolA-binding protein
VDVRDVLGSVASAVPFLLSAVVVLGWLDMLRPARRRVFVTDRASGAFLALMTAWVLLAWEIRLASLSPGTRRVLVGIHGALLALMLVPGLFFLRPKSRDFRQGVRLAKHEDWAGAAAAYRRVLDGGRRGEAAQAAASLGRCLYRQGEYEGAAAALRQAIDARLPRISPGWILGLGYALHAQGDEQGARAAYEQVLGIRRTRHAGAAARALSELNARSGD